MSLCLQFLKLIFGSKDSQRDGIAPLRLTGDVGVAGVLMQR